MIVPDVGGAFGQKINVGREETALALAARLLGRPVKWSEDRYENLVAAPHSRAEEAEVSIALDADGTFLRCRSSTSTTSARTRPEAVAPASCASFPARTRWGRSAGRARV